MLSAIPVVLFWGFSAILGSLWKRDVLSTTVAALSVVGTVLSNDHDNVRTVKCYRNPC